MNLEQIGLGVLSILEDLGKTKKELIEQKNSSDMYSNYWQKSMEKVSELELELDVIKSKSNLILKTKK